MNFATLFGSLRPLLSSLPLLLFSIKSPLGHRLPEVPVLQLLSASVCSRSLLGTPPYHSPYNTTILPIQTRGSLGPTYFISRQKSNRNDEFIKMVELKHRWLLMVSSLTTFCR